MKKIFNIVLNIIPFFVWMIWFYLALIDVKTKPDLGMIQILLLLGLPLLYSIYNVIFAKDKKEFVIYNAIFGFSQVIGYYISGILYYNFISADSETILVINTFSVVSIIYILAAALIFYGIRAIIDKLKINKFSGDDELNKKIKWLIPTVVFIVSLAVLFRPAGRVTFDKSVSENRILFQYEILGCGSVIGKVLDGGEEITAKFIEQYPNIGTNEIVFTDDSDEPEKHMDIADFYSAGLAEKYTYVIEGKSVGVTKGADDCCEPENAYNENVAEFKVDRWYFTTYVPYMAIGDVFVILPAFVALLISFIWLLVLIVLDLYRFVKKKKLRPN